MTRTGRRRVVVWGGVAVLGIAALTVAMLPRPVPADMAAIDRGRLAVTLDHEGRTRVRDRYVVTAPLPGRVLRIDLEPGDPVRAHDTVLATFVPAAPAMLDERSRAEAQSRVRAVEATLARARAEREQVRAQSEFAQAERRRIRSLAGQGIASAQELEAAETEARARARGLEAADAAVVAAERDLDTARAALLEPTGRGRSAAEGGVLRLRSPIDGVVLQRFQESEATVPQGQPLVEVGDVAALEVIADFLSADAVRIAAGMPVLIEQWGGGTPLNGRVTRVEPSAFLKISALGVEEQRVWVVIGFNDPRSAWRALGDGYRVEARVVIWERPDVLRAPTSSLFRQGDGWAAFAVENGRARLRAVTVGHRNGTTAEVVSGLNAGDRVVIHPSDRITDGVRVTERGQ